MLFLFIFSLQLFAEGGSNDPQITISPSSKTVIEGNSGVKNVTFTISVNQCPSLLPIKIKYATSNGSAQSGSDYNSANGSITFNTGTSCQKSYSLSVNVRGDTKVESNESFYIQLSDNGTNSYQKYHWGTQRATVVINNDDETQNVDLAITKTNDKPKPVNIGDVATYTIVGKNNGPKSSKISIWDTLPDNMKFISVSDNSSSFNCSYNNSDRKVRCSGSRVFSKNQSVTVTVKAKVLNNQTYTLRNYAGIESADSPKKSDNNTNNNRAHSDISTNSIDLGVVKSVLRKDGSYHNSANYDVGEDVTFKIVFGNYNTLPSTVHFEDSLPSGLQLLNINVTSKPSNFSCSTSENRVTCDGSHLFTKGEEVTLYVNAKVQQQGRFYNTAYVNSPLGYRESSTSNNHDSAYVNVGLDGEKLTANKVVSPPKDGEYHVGDIVTFTIRGKNFGTSSKVRIRDWLNKNGSTNGAFEYISAKTDPTLDTTMQCGTSGSGRNFNITCSSSKIEDKKEFGIKIKAKLKKEGRVCNRAHFYKRYNNWTWMNSASACFDVAKPKSAPLLNASEFTIRLGEAVTINLQDYTTDADTPKDRLIYKLLTKLPNGLQMSTKGLITGTYSDSSGTFPKIFPVRVQVSDDDGLSSSDSFKIVVKATDIVANDNYYKIPINSTLNGNLITDANAQGDHPFAADIGEGLKVVDVVPKTLTYTSNGAFGYKAPLTPVTLQYTYTIKDKYGQTDYAILKIEVYKPPIKAEDDILQVAKNTPLSANVFADNGSGLDVGDDLNVTNYSKPSHGTLTISIKGDLTYTPDSDYVGKDSASYTIKDRYGQSDKGVIYFNVGAIYQEDYADFYLVNPPQIRNMIGNYITIGNTVECITEKVGSSDENNSFNGTCQKDHLLSNNDHMVQYIDIDNNSKFGTQTWNSSSATFTLPKSYLKIDGGAGIAWAGLFWQGSVNNKAGFKQRRASGEYGSGYSYKEIKHDEPISLATSGASRVLINIDNNKAGYTEVNSDTFYNDLSHGVYGGYYAAYANITNLLQNANLSSGEHTVTVANIVTNEGREANIGNYGGWSLVIIYKEDITGKPRNISIYNGYQPIGKGGNTNVPSKTVQLSGFRLPKSGPVESRISAFVGEGEKKYGGTQTVYDKMYIKDPNTNSIYDMPSSNPNNIFDATIENIQRKSGSCNDIANTNGIDVDSFNVSDIMQKIRDNKVDSDSIDITVVSKDKNIADGDQSDYVTASMLAFSTELYAPKICYDYDLRLGNYIDIPSSNRNFSTENFANGQLQLKVMLRSQEADFDLLDTKLSNIFTPNSVFKYISGEAKYTPPNTYTYIPAVETDTNKGEIAIGDSVTTAGGVLGPKQSTYAKMFYKFLKPSFSGKFDILLNAKISFDGISKVPYQMSTAVAPKSVFYIKRCDTNPVYNPIYGTFNVERGDSAFTQNEAERYSLYTQVVGVPYNVSIASYTKDSNGKFTKPIASRATVELELIDGGSFDNNSSAGYDSVCQDPDTYNRGTFVHFGGKERVVVKIPQDYPTYPNNLALQNAIFRVWSLTKDVNGTKVIINHNCQSQSDSSCFENIYAKEYKNSSDKGSHLCLSDCTGTSGTTCYDCLRKHFATPICSRDNFAIRPDSYSVAISDNNETKSKKRLSIGLNDGPVPKDIAAGYIYSLDINASSSPKKRVNVDGYFFVSDSNSTEKSSVAYFSGPSSCTQRGNIPLDVTLLNGTTQAVLQAEDNSTKFKNALLIDNSGRYNVHIKDSWWSRVDQKGYPYKPFSNRADCIKGSSAIHATNPNEKSGCESKTGAGGTFADLALALHPYRFDLSTITMQANPNGASGYVYVNDLNATRSSVKDASVMALKVAGQIVALGKDGKQLSNYQNGCSAYSLDIALDYNKTPADIVDNLKRPLQLNYALYDAAAGDNVVSVNRENNSSSINLVFDKKYFYSPSRGHYNSYFNFKRDFNAPIVPFELGFGDMNASSPQEKLSVDMQRGFIPKGSIDLNSSKIFYYAKVKSKSDFYDDVGDDNITTPIEVRIFCNKSLSYCSKYGIDTNKTMTNEYDWWLNVNHNASLGEGEARLVANPSSKASVTPLPIKNFIQGVASDVTVVSLDRLSADLPYTVTIVPTDIMKTKTPWLLYNQYLNTPPKYIYKVRFVDSPAAWSGQGSAGHTINVDSTGRKTKKVDW